MARRILFGLAALFCLPGGAVLFQMVQGTLGLSLPFWAELILVVIFALVPAVGLLSERVVRRGTGWAICLMGYAALGNALGPGRDIAEQVAWIVFGGVAGVVVGIFAPPGKTIVPFHRRRSRRAEADSSGDGSSKPGRLQFSLRTLFVIVAVVGVILGFFSRSSMQVVRQQRMVAAIRRVGGNVHYRDDHRSAPLVVGWLEDVVGKRSRDSVVAIVLGRGVGDAQLLELDLEALSELRDVRLWSSQVGDAGLAHLRQLEKLQSLSLGQRTTNAGLTHLKGLTNLRWLRLSGTKVTDAGLLHLKHWPQLEGLDLDATQVSDAGLVYLKDVPKLRYLNLSATRVTDAGLVHLEGLPRLEALKLSGTSITDKGLVHLKNLANLSGLDLAGTKVTDRGLCVLKNLTQLDHLTLNNTKVTDAGLVHLKDLPGDSFVRLRGTQVTGAALEQLRRERPDLDVGPQPR